MNFLGIPNLDPIPSPLWRSGIKHVTPQLMEVWRGSLDRYQAPSEASASLDNLKRAHVVVTGQQPGVWGGPLYSAYKAATAVALAEQVQVETGELAVAVFWMGADDTDHDEIGWGCLPNRAGELFRHRWPAPADARSWVGNRVIPFPLDALNFVDSAVPFWGAPDPHESVSLADGFARLLYKILGRQGLLVFDARWTEASHAGAALWEGYLKTHEAISAAVQNQGEALVSRNLAAPLMQQSNRGLFLIEDGRRMETATGEWETTVREALRTRKQLAPSVLLRAPLQDYLFGSAAHIVGRGEAAYLRQLTPVYERLGIHNPPRVPRLQATAVPRDWIPAVERAAAVGDPEAFVARQVEGPGSEIGDLERVVVARLEGIETKWGGGQAGSETIRSVEKKLRHQLSKLQQSLDREARRRLYKGKPYLRHLSEFLLPRRSVQDRGLSAVSLLLWLGEGVGDALAAAGAKHIESLRTGCSNDWVMEIEYE